MSQRTVTALRDVITTLKSSRRESNIREMKRAVRDLQSTLFDGVNLLAGNDGVISGYCSVFGNVDSHGEVVDAGAFSKSLAAHKAEGTMPLMLWQHNLEEPIGVWDYLQEDSKGLYGRGRILSQVQRGAEALALIDAGAMFGLSIGYTVIRDRFVQRVRHLVEVNLVEVSVVSLGSNPSARLMRNKEYQ